MTEPTTTADAPQEEVPIFVGGRVFWVTKETTFEQDLYIMSIMRKTGLEQLAAEFDVTKTDELSVVAQDVIMTTFSNGQFFEMLGGILEEDDAEWTQEGARENAKFFATLRDPEDKAALRGCVVSMILSFFVSGLLSSGNLGKSSIKMQPAPDAPGAEPPIAESMTSASGTPSSATSPTTGSTSIPSS